MDIVANLRALVGRDAVLDADELGQRSAGFMRPDTLKAAALVRPASTEQVSAVLKWCHDHGVGVVTQGGLTGLVHGADAEPDEVILSTERMQTIEAIDPIQRTATVQAGVILQTLQDAVEEHDLIFPLDLGARGSATIGGNAATNAGGNRVIRFGMMRDMVLGLEAVLADGTIVSSLNPLIKNNTGYDLKQLFIGSEGTLGVITRLVLRLRERPRSTQVALTAVDSFAAVVRFLKHMDRSLGGTLSAFEVMWQPFYELVTTPPAQARPPLPHTHPYYVLVEAQGHDNELEETRFHSVLGTALDDGLIADAVIARSGSEASALWAMRDDVGQVMRDGIPLVFDISLPVAAMEAYVEQLRATLPAAHKLRIFGHLGDGNLHVVVTVPPDDLRQARPAVEKSVYEPLQALRGSVSAEHGIGLEKKRYLNISRSPEEIALMGRLKAFLDPKDILNPGKVI